jgi:hypothetical protein
MNHLIQITLASAVLAGCSFDADAVAGSHHALTGAEQCADLAASVGGLCPDITEEAPAHLNIQRAHGREVLRFTSTHWNEGAGPLQIRGGGETEPCVIEEGGTLIDSICTFSTQEILDASRTVVHSQPAGVALFHPEHNHWHQDNVADFVLRAGSLDGEVVGQATKVTYCLIDYDAGGNGLTAEKFYFECNADLQGISVGFGDEYHHATHGQEIDITTIPPGIYYLTHEADPTGKWLELDDDNNTSWVRFEIRRDSGSGNASLTELGTSACTGLACGNTSNR